MISDRGILYIEPSAQVSDNPIVDDLTRKMTAALRRSRAGPGYRGHHTCKCGAHSSNCDYVLPNGEKTNSLCIHYLAYHRSEVPEDHLVKVRGLSFGEEEPTIFEMKGFYF